MQNLSWRPDIGLCGEQYAAAARAKPAGRPLVLAGADMHRAGPGEGGEGVPGGGDSEAARSRKRKKDPRRPTQVRPRRQA